MFQLANGSEIGLAWRRPLRMMGYWMYRETSGMEKRIRIQGGNMQEQDGVKSRLIKESWKVCEGLKRWLSKMVVVELLQQKVSRWVVMKLE